MKVLRNVGEVTIIMSFILARENAGNLLNTCSQTQKWRGERATNTKVKQNTSVAVDPGQVKIIIADSSAL